MLSSCHRQLENDGELTHVGFFKSGLPLIIIAHLWRLFIPNQPISAQSCRLGSSLRLCFIVAPSDPHTKSAASITCAAAALRVLLKGGEVQRARTVSDFWQRARWLEINKVPVMGPAGPPGEAAPPPPPPSCNHFVFPPLSVTTSHHVPPPPPLLQMNPNKQRMDWQHFWHRPFISPTKRWRAREGGVLRRQPVGWAECRLWDDHSVDTWVSIQPFVRVTVRKITVCSGRERLWWIGLFVC